jgi:pyruvate dehydrogenase E2 component (dihydrolipoamide acetyltransferase)
LQVGDGSKNVQVNSVIAITAEEGDDLSGADKLAAEAESDTPAPASSGEEAKEEPEPKKEEKAPEPSSSSSSAPSSSEAPSDKPADRIFASPLARKMAQEKGIPLAQIKGSGPNGRITKTDVESYKPSSAPSSSQPAASPSAGKAAAPSAPPAPPAGASSADYTDVPVSSMRRVIAQRLTESKQQLPHYYVSIDVEMDRVLQLREVFNQAAVEKAGPANADKAKKAKLSVGDFITKAAAVALREVPDVNAAWYGEVIRQHHKQDISIAVATPTGLITPIVKDVGGKGLTSISAQTKELASRARDGKLKPEEYQGGSFTISNMGMFGITHFTAIINSPQSAILAIGGTEPRIVPDETSEKGWKKVNIMQATISADHRTIDGATAAKWMKAFKDALENPLR